MPNPGTGIFRFNNASIALQVIFIDVLDFGSIDRRHIDSWRQVLLQQVTLL
jgi:hypothetical protein